MTHPTAQMLGFFEAKLRGEWLEARVNSEKREHTAEGFQNRASASPNFCSLFRMRTLLLILCCARLLTANTLQAADAWIWWEGESPSSSNFPVSTWLSPSSQTERDALSGGNIRTVVGVKPTGSYWANYTVNVAQAGTYRFYVRKIWQYGVFKWRFDSAAWTVVNGQMQLMDSANYKEWFPLNWIYLGNVTLTAGAHTFRVEINAADWPNAPEKDYVDLGGFDAFMLSTQPFIPRGKLKPNEKYNLAEPGKWNFEPPPDDFSPTALLDLRSLNERVAGQSGFVRAADDQSGRYVLGDGTPVKFWGVLVANIGSELASFSQQARFLAKRGVNLVRYHQQLPASDPNDINAVDPTFVEGAHRAVGAFKQEGIYTEFSLFWELPFTIRKEWGVDGYTADKSAPAAVLMFDEKLKAAYKEWARRLLTVTNAYTGLTLAQDPAVAIIEIQNEDSLLWWTFDPSSFPQAQREKLEGKFGAFLISKYGNLAAAQAAWGQVTIPGQTDNPASGRMALAGAWYMTAGSTDSWFLALTPRIADQIQFLTELQRAFYQEMRDHYRNTLGCQSLISSCNWAAADERILLDAERYSYTANDLIDRHPYFNPAIHVDPNLPDTSSYMVDVGDLYQGIAGVRNPRHLPTVSKQVAGFPHHASESTWVNPSRYKAEGPLLVAAYNSMAAVDGWVWFATRVLGYEDIVNKHTVAVPSLMGQFPGAALLYRRGDVAEAPVAIREERNLSRLYHKELALSSEFDPSRNPPDNPVYDPLTGTGRIDPLAMLVGKVECHYGTSDASNYVSPLLFSQMDVTNRTVESLPPPGNTHGQLRLDWGKGLFRVNSPRSQGIAGFLNSVAQVDLDDVSITSSNEFGAILVIALDNLPIAQSQKLLIQAVTEDNPYHWQEQDQVFTNNNVVYTGKKIVSMGQPPMNVVNIAGTVTLKGLGQGRSVAVRVLDENGYDRGNGVSQVNVPDLKITLPTNSLYTDVMMPPNSTSQPQSQTVLVGSNANFSVVATGVEPLSYQWRFNGGPLSGATNASLSVSSAPASQAGNYSVVITNVAGATTSVVAVLTVNVPTTITAPPQSQTNVVGTKAIFSVAATGTAPLSYQWRFNGMNLTDDGRLAGSQSNLLTIASVLMGDAGQYEVVVTNAYGCATSGLATLTVLQASPVVTWASPAAITYGTALSASQLNASASVPGSLAYSPALGTVLNSGARALSVIFTPTDTVNYRGATGSVSMVVLPAPLTVTAANANRVYGQTNPVFAGTVIGLQNGDDITATYNCSATSTSQAGTYSIVPSLADPNDRQTNYSVSLVNGTLTVAMAAPLLAWATPDAITYGTALSSNQLNATANVPGSFAYSPALGTVLDSGTHTLSVVFTPTDTIDYSSATGSVSLVVLPAPLTVAAVNTNRIYGQTNPGFSGTIVGLVIGDDISANYSCVATPTSLPGSYPIVPGLVDPNDRQTNYLVSLVDGTLTVTPATPPTIVTVSPNTGPTNGGTTVIILGTGFQDGVTVSFGTLPAASLNLISATNLTAVTLPSWPGTVDVVLTNADGQTVIFTNGFTYVAPLGEAPSIVSQPTNQTAVSGTFAMFSVSATGTEPLHYQWQFNSMNLTDSDRISGSQSNLLTIASVLVGDAGDYAVIVTNAYGSATSAAATLAVVTPPVFLTVAQTAGTITFTWSATTGQRYQVQSNTNLIQTNWSDLGSFITATNAAATTTDTIGSSQRFYRVVLLP